VVKTNGEMQFGGVSTLILLDKATDLLPLQTKKKILVLCKTLLVLW
jgi:hypothetical protein